MEKALHSNTDANDDGLLMQRVGKGDRSAFAALYDRFSTPLYSLALKMLANETEAREVLREAFLLIWTKASTFRPERNSTFSWLIFHLRDRVIDRLRSRRRREELVDNPDLDPTSVANPSANENGINERAREIRSALAELPEEQSQILRMAFFEGLTQAEIAQKLEEPPGIIKAHAFQGMVRLRTTLRHYS